MNREVQITEAIKRLEFMKERGLSHTPAVNVFKRGMDVPVFENQGKLFDAVFYCLKLNAGDNGKFDKMNEIYRRLESEGSVVYLVQVTHTKFGIAASFFYVSDSPEEWGMDWDDLKEGYSCCYVSYLDMPEYSEYGSIGFTYSKSCGGIVRTA